jgi:hypothetical protein
MTAPDFLWNVLVEVVGLAIGIPVGTYRAIRAARQRTSSIAPPFVRMVKQLREDQQLSPSAAHTCVECIAQVLTHELTRAGGPSVPRRAGERCTVCSKDFMTKRQPGGETTCARCGLPANVWNLIGGLSE